jgi:hypothetical protein
MEIGCCDGTCHITFEYTEQLDESLIGVMKVVALVKPLNNKMENIFKKYKMEL